MRIVQNKTYQPKFQAIQVPKKSFECNLGLRSLLTELFIPEQTTRTAVGMQQWLGDFFYIFLPKQEEDVAFDVLKGYDSGINIVNDVLADTNIYRYKAIHKKAELAKLN